jgi:hypothetical protein
MRKEWESRIAGYEAAIKQRDARIAELEAQLGEFKRRVISIIKNSFDFV